MAFTLHQFYSKKAIVSLLLLQETLKELFPSLKALKRHREVFLFVSRLMKDPRPLLQHLYEMQVDKYLNQMRTGHRPSIDTDLLKSLHAESTIQLVNDPFRNQYINFNYFDLWMFDDTRQVYWPSRVYDFNHMTRKVELDHHTEEEEIPPCAMFIDEPNKSVRDSLLSTCSEIFKHQAVTDLYMYWVICDSLEVPRLIKPVSLHLLQCALPVGFMEKILRQLIESRCGESLQRLELDSVDLEPFESLMDELLEDLVAHHQSKREAGLNQRKLKVWLRGDEDNPTNLSREFVKKWRNRCKKVDSIDCVIETFW